MPQEDSPLRCRSYTDGRHGPALPVLAKPRLELCLTPVQLLHRELHRALLQGTNSIFISRVHVLLPALGSESHLRILTVVSDIASTLHSPWLIDTRSR
jgi:hypothetical protein